MSGLGVVVACVTCALLAASSCVASDLPNDSLYQLRVQLVSQTGSKVGLNLDQGYPTLLSMFYGSCTAACPMLITSIQVYESHLDPASQARLRVLLVSFDPSADTPEQLAKLAQLHRADPVRWTFASASETDARKIAALLGFSYRRLPDGTFDHSLLIKLLDREGRVVGATTTLVGDTEFQAKLQKATSANAP